jgi:hypothetical protein
LKNSDVEISTGFNHERDFQSTVLLQKYGSEIFLNSHDLLCLINRANDISLFFKEHCADHVIQDSSDFSKTIIEARNGKDSEKTLIFKSQEDYIIFYANDWDKFLILKDFLYSVNEKNMTLVPLVKDYFSKYIEKCVTFDTHILNTTHYFLSNKYCGQKPINYFRLFTEISFKCSQLIDDLLSK